MKRCDCAFAVSTAIIGRVTASTNARALGSIIFSLLSPVARIERSEIRRQTMPGKAVPGFRSAQPGLHVLVKGRANSRSFDQLAFEAEM